MMVLNEFLLCTDSESYNIYIRIKGENVSICLQKFIDENPYSWKLYKVSYITPDFNDLIIEVKRD